MFDSAMEIVVLLVILLLLIIGILYFIFYPAIVNYRKCRTNNGNVITLTTMTVINPDLTQNTEINGISKLEQELDVNFTARDLASSATKSPTSTNDSGKEPPILSIVIPAYDEEQRLPTMLQTAYSYLNQTSCPAMHDLALILPSSTKRKVSLSSDNNNENSTEGYDIEWIVVNDGSKDHTSLAYETFIRQSTATSKNTTTSKSVRMLWKLVSFSKNCGKGAAVQAGMRIATGQFRLMVDADGATDFGPGLHLLIQRLKQEMMEDRPTISTSVSNETIEFPIIFGSRAHLHQSSSDDSSDQQEQPQKRSVIRSFLMQAFHVCVMLLVGSGGGSSSNNKQRRPPIVDTQCGFKLFPAYAAERLFAILHLQRWAFDIELVYIIQSLLDYNCIEVVVPWKEIDGSKLNTSPYNLALVAICMLRDMICVRLCYTFGIWNIKTVNPGPLVLSNHHQQQEHQQVMKKER